MPVIPSVKWKSNSATQIGLKNPSVTSIIGNTAGVKIIGGAATTADLSFQTTSGVGTTGADMHFLVGNAGATEAMTILNNGNVGIGTTGPEVKLYSQGTGASPATSGSTLNGLFGIGASGGNGLFMGGYTGSPYALWLQAQDFGDASITYPIVLNPIAGNVGIGTTSPTNLLSLGGESARIFWMEREQTANTAGNTLTITAGGATSGATDKAGGALILQGGLSTGSAESGVTIQGCVAGAAGTADRTQTTAIQVLGNKIGFYGVTPITRAVLATGASHTVDDVITALQNLGLVSQS